MAAKYDKFLDKGKEKYPYPTQFGSHASMIDEEKTLLFNPTWKAIKERLSVQKVAELIHRIKKERIDGKYMLVVTQDTGEKVELPNTVVCKDGDGLYVTDISMLDCGLCDRNRYNKRTEPIDMPVWELETAEAVV